MESMTEETWTCERCSEMLGGAPDDYEPPRDPRARCDCCDRLPSDAERLVAAVMALASGLRARATAPVAPAPGSQLLPTMRPTPPARLVALPGGPAFAASPTAPPLESLLNVKGAARFLGMSADWVYRAAEQGRIPYRKVGSRLRFVPEELQAWASGDKRLA